ncbi:DUF1257 domain-containing protein [Stackebrandtia nassauensis]|uniref:DUF1257 domain-containing protein n=1 Tax=Stackebrandtia nassauensis (strain DSM 44728 / CIP 108903 / NRRL B-16338 / NBRC 102104 / LLR-40K-21) TaxID=446470 RepID=D3QC24_STANL|nr:DUF1257 domain-containing protein [Stackebrandtia nassauensis]ADD44913.1 hypothetical protein Snas_5279 [Stackebrandtia nassauensis DSM 44728]
MSHFTRVRTTLTDTATLAAALRELGFAEVEVHDTAQALHGHRGDVRPETAEVIVRRQHLGIASNDLGFARREDGSYEAIVSEFDRRKYGEAWMKKLLSTYGYLTAVAFAEQHGFAIATDEVETEGTRRLTLRRTVV